MNFNILDINLIGPILAILTFVLVRTDRAFSKKVRSLFELALVAVFVLCFRISYEKFINIYQDSSGNVILLIDSILRPLVVLLLIYTTGLTNKVVNVVLAIPVIINVFIAFLDFHIVSFVLFACYIFLFIALLITEARDKEKSQYLFAISLFLMVGYSMVVEYLSVNKEWVNLGLCLVTCLYYYYLVMRTYKRDGLTGLFIRHNLNYELADLQNKGYDIVLIDVDNFKLINDKYGHDKGDEALVTIVKEVKRHLLKGCRMYRFGGDEFVIISRKVSEELLRKSLEDTNNDLAKNDLHISFGIVRHNPGDDTTEVLVSADKAMYENKRMLKSESIWDDMTGLYNYRGFLDEMEIFTKSVYRDGKDICLVAVDVEHLSNINMAYGYTEGNVVIAALARILKNSLRGRDFIGHLGSDEFVVAVEISSPDDPYIQEYLNILNEGMDSAYEFAGRDYTVKINTGVHVLDRDNQVSAEDSINDVLYVKQEDKENRRKTDVSDDQDYNNQDEIAVMDILDNNKLKYALQPIVSAKDGHIEAYEFLMRSDTEPMISPLKILKYAEKNKCLYDVELKTFNNVLNLIKNDIKLPDGTRIFINSIPGNTFRDEDYEELKSKFGDYFHKLTIEITEQREIDDDDLAMINCRRGSDGFSLAIDDYGSGCSNTNSLLRYTPEIVKLDRLLITGIDRNTKKQFFVNSIITFARENDMLILAEGVETENELKTVIRLGVDLIQGYYTAKPSFEPLVEIPEKVRKIIINEHLKVGSNARKTYTAGSDGDLSLLHLAMEDYSKINISTEELKISGSSEYTADCCIKIKDGINCDLTLMDVKLNSIDDLPCLDIGEGSNVVLRLEGNNTFNYKGIRVPEGSTLTIKGPGNIDLNVKGHDCYGIGVGYESEFGNIILRNSGTIKVVTDGENCIGIGGGVVGEHSAITIKSGLFELVVAGVDAVGIGCFRGTPKIRIAECAIKADFRVNTGSVIGSIFGNQDVVIKNYKIEANGSGSRVAVIGTCNQSEGNIEISAGTFISKLSGHIIYLVGANEGDIKINISKSRLDLCGEGDMVMGFGAYNLHSDVKILDCAVGVVLNASLPRIFGAEDEKVRLIGPSTDIKINGSIYDLPEVMLSEN